MRHTFVVAGVSRGACPNRRLPEPNRTAGDKPPRYRPYGNVCHTERPPALSVRHGYQSLAGLLVVGGEGVGAVELHVGEAGGAVSGSGHRRAPFWSGRMGWVAWTKLARGV